jgi:hypothetical protein
MGTAETARTIVDKAEKQLRDLIGVAGSEGNYDLAQQIVGWAKALGEILGTMGEARTGGTTNRGDTQNGAVTPAPSKRAARSANRYPRFFRAGEQLVKVGWSKKDSKEYIHRAGRSVLDALAARVAQKGQNGKLFTAEALQPLVDPATSQEWPTYQVYVALAWLKQVGLLEQKGRVGYRARVRSRVTDAVDSAWNELREFPV